MDNERSNKETTRQLPEYTIGNTVFLVDAVNRELREKANQTNVLLFENMHYKGAYYDVWYGDKNTPMGVHRIPNLVDIDPEGMAERLNIPVKELKGKTDFEVMVDQQFYRERQNGQQPTIEIAGYIYNVDYFWSRLRPHINPQNTVNHWPDDLAFEKLESINDDTAYQFFFDKKKQALFDFDADIVAIPPDIFLVTIPAGDKLDPFAYARDWSNNIQEHLMENPPQRHFVASLVPAEQTFLKDMIKENRERFKLGDDDKFSNNNQKMKR